MSKRSSKSRAVIWIVVAVLVLALAGGAAYGVLCWYIPYRDAENTMPADGIMTMWEQEDGSLLLEWPEGNNADTYTLEVINSQGSVLYAYTTPQRSCILPKLPRDTELTLRVSSAGAWRDRFRPGNEYLEVDTVLEPPKVQNLVWTVDPDTDVAKIRFDDRKDTYYNVYMAVWGEPEFATTLAEGSVELSFGENGTIPIPPFDTTYTVLFDAVREQPGLTYYGQISASMELCREDFLGTVLTLRNNDLGNNAWELFWNETKGDHYEVQQLQGEEWVTIATVQQEEILTYYTGHLKKFEEFSFRVIAVGGQAEGIQSEQLDVETGAAAVYCTIWPLVDLEVYEDETREQVLGTVKTGKALCVLEEKEGLFGIRYNGQTAYIDSSYCMINLPEYMEDLCYYDITNSHNSIYMVHDYEIPEVTDTVIKGYEKIQMYNGDQLVPLLYPAAKKLVVAANMAREQGYILKIYDAFRPRQATLNIYELTEKILDDPIPEWTFQEKLDRIEAGLPIEPTTQPTTTPPTEPSTEATDPTEGTGEPAEGTEETSESTEAPSQETEAPTTEDILTYRKLMTDNGRYKLGNFLAQVASNHNYGIALDLTLVNARGEDVEMQTAMHDLSWFSEVEANNKEAKKLRKIMLDAGFGPLVSEWWHFQDNDAKAELSLKAMANGVTPECWMADDYGWRYRTASGKYYKDCRKVIDGIAYVFDENGYATPA